MTRPAMAAIGVGVEGAIGAVQLASAAGRAALEYRRRTHQSPQQVAYEPRLGRGVFTIRVGFVAHGGPIC